jgi:hypothetical protein
MYYYPFDSSRAATILCRRKLVAEAMYYYPFGPSRAATILRRRKLVAEVMWGSLATCGRLAIRLAPATGNLPAEIGARLRLAAMRGRLPKPAADWQSARRYRPKSSPHQR